MVARFDGRNPRAERVARELSSRLVTMIVDDQREAIRVVIEDGIAKGRGPRDTALDIVGRVNRATGKREGGIVGLNAPQTRVWTKIRDALETPEGVRSLLVKDQATGKWKPALKSINTATFNRLVRAASKGEALSRADAALSMRQVSNAMLKERGEAIARTETMTSLNAGRDQGIRQLIEAGSITEDQVRKIWDSSGADGRTRDTHLGMEAQERRLDEPFVTPMGYRLMHPGDASLGAPGSETINCRCVLRFSLDVYRGLK